ncbi:hypothetical protein VTN77DRAFT_3045 [Rasamsonia byssochlamydoides]|uniref:uncharacterized protein n=1 Tax=Rasamsonia byssochlamydoides TaxID=89139 RepID=UPI0037444BA1
MDAYPEDYVAHNLPLILLSGLEPDPDHGVNSAEAQYPLLQEKGTQIESDFPLLSGQLVDDLRTAFLQQDASGAPWNARSHTGWSSGIGLRIKIIGRSYRLPPRKADPPENQIPPVSPSIGPILHSPISPLTPGSPTFPDGVLTPLWVTKHQNLIPAAVINVFPMTSDPNMSTLRDNQLKIEINGLKDSWASSGYKTRFVVVLVAEDGINIQDLDDRLASIRRATNLDPRSLFILFPDLSAVEVKDFVRSLLSSLQPSIVEYYRDLSKHARRKRNRGTIPPPTAPPISGTSQTLSLQGWNVRYEFKLGIFAEFRQEMDAAHRNYESAYETLFGEEVFESIAGWNPRFNDARLLADVLAIRIIRCLLWSGQTTTAVRSWLEHRARTEDIVSRKGKGTKNYGWEAWEARWSTVMAQLISRAELPAFSEITLSDPSRLHESIFHQPEKSLPVGERMFPWELLHHEGYWLDRSAIHSVYRRTLAEQIPGEDRVPPGQSPASQIAGKSYLYDTYLVPEPHVEAPPPGQSGFDHSTLIIDTLKASLEHFAARQQVRKVESLSLELAKEYMRVGLWTDAHKILLPLWPQLTWRSAGWWELIEDFAWTLRECSLRVHDCETLIWVNWELLNRVFPRRPSWNYDFHNCLQDITVDRPKPAVVLKAEEVVSCLSASLVFEKPTGNVGEPLQVQLVITSVAQPDSAPIALSEVKIVFEGSLRPIKLQPEHDVNESDSSSCHISTVTLRDSTASTDSSTPLSPTGGMASMIGTANLTFRPSQTRVYNLTSIPREAGEAKIASITLLIEEEKFNLVYAISRHRQMASYWWVNSAKGPLRKRIGKDRDTTVCKILPKPPKIVISTPNLRETYYTNERVILNVAIQNDEEEAADVTLQVRLFGQAESAAKLLWANDDERPAESGDTAGGSPNEDASHSISRSIGILERAASMELPIVLSETHRAMDYELEISVRYSLVSDVETPISKTVVVDLPFVRPFEANYEFLPRIHPQPWPNFFFPDDDLAEDGSTSKPNGLQQRWCVNSKVVSFASEPLIIEKVSLVLLDIHGGALCDISEETLISPEAPQIFPEELRESEFTLNIQKTSLEDRRSATLNLALEIHWRRPTADGSDPSTTTSLAIPRFLIPMGEPRVLASASSSETLPGLIHLDYTLENPSMHFLTFNLTMEASEQFAFSGPKTKVVQLVPLSRHTVRYNLLAFKRGQWIQPHVVVVDTYFNKTLRVLPTEGMRADKKGILVWIDADG